MGKLVIAMYRPTPLSNPLSFNVSFLENPTEYPYKPYIANN